MTGPEVVAGSFRDPSGFLFLRDGILYRQINVGYRQAYDRLMGSGLYEALARENLLVPHQEVAVTEAAGRNAYKVIRPQRLPFISYPYEWCFGQLKAAALATLRVHEIALRHGMILKDASAYNIQFHGGRAIFIDTLSFEDYREGKPWVAYRQFCRHFLAPLALQRYRDAGLGRLLQVYLDGVPLALAARLLPRRTLMRLPLLLHLHLQARAEEKLGRRGRVRASGRVSRRGLQGIVDNLRAGVEALELKLRLGGWGDYYERTNYSQEAWREKGSLVERFLDRLSPDTVWDLGANTGFFSRMAAKRARLTVAFDADPEAVEVSYRRSVADSETGLLPLVVDLTNPSPGLGWEGEERAALPRRGRPDAVLALALVHHLAIGNNLPLDRIARYFAGLGGHLIVEFVPKSDSQVERMLATREDIFADYSREGFESAFRRHFDIRDSRAIRESERRLYLMTALASHREIGPG